MASHRLVDCSETNSRGIVALCACGWVSEAVMNIPDENGHRTPRTKDAARARAVAIHCIHADDARTPRNTPAL